MANRKTKSSHFEYSIILLFKSFLMRRSVHYNRTALQFMMSLPLYISWLDVFVNATSFYLKHIFGAIYCVHRVDYVWMNIWADRFVNNIFVFRYEIEDYYKLEILTCCWASDVSFPESFTTIGELKWKTNNIDK